MPELVGAPTYPDTRFMGSKRRLLPHLADVVGWSTRSTFVDAFAGSGCVSHAAKTWGYRTLTNDVLRLSHTWCAAAVENSTERLSTDDVEQLLEVHRHGDDFIARTFAGLYFSDDENALLDAFSHNARRLDPPRRALALAAMTRACLKRRPRGVFTYVGVRYDDGRRDLRLSLADHFRESVAAWNGAVFDNGHDNRAHLGSALALEVEEPALVYLDPPYFSTRSDNDYTRRYHFLEGLVCYWDGLTLQQGTKTKKFATTSRDFQSRAGAYASFEALFDRLAPHDLLVSYSSSSLPSKDELLAMLHRRGRQVEVVEIPHVYSFGTHGHKVANVNNRVQEFLFFSPAR